jgi:hypothetical protein
MNDLDHDLCLILPLVSLPYLEDFEQADLAVESVSPTLKTCLGFWIETLWSSLASLYLWPNGFSNLPCGLCLLHGISNFDLAEAWCVILVAGKGSAYSFGSS